MLQKLKGRNTGKAQRSNNIQQSSAFHGGDPTPTPTEDEVGSLQSSKKRTESTHNRLHYPTTVDNRKLTGPINVKKMLKMLMNSDSNMSELTKRTMTAGSDAQ